MISTYIYDTFYVYVHLYTYMPILSYKHKNGITAKSSNPYIEIFSRTFCSVTVRPFVHVDEI